MLKKLIFLLFPIALSAQYGNEYQGLLWKISGNGLEKPSYLYGTMHVSNRVAFHLSQTFFDALDSADMVALETNPETWVRDLTSSTLYRDYFQRSYRGASSRFSLYESFLPKEPTQSELEYYLSRDQDMLNNLLFRMNQSEQDFEENTYLDLFIFQVGKKKDKKIIPLEDFQESSYSVMKAGKRDKDAVRMTNRQAQEMLGNFDSWQQLLEDAYRRGDLDLMDTMNTLLYPGKYYRRYMLDERNEIMVEGLDTLMQKGSLFTGVGAAHLPGDMGVINLLRERGYTVEAEERSITSQSIAQKERIDSLIYRYDLQDFQTEDQYISTKVPGKMAKLVSDPYQEYIFADMANGGFYSLRRIATFGKIFGKDAAFYQTKIDSLLFENIPGKILSKDTIELEGYTAYDIRNKTRTGDNQRYHIVFTPLEVLIFKVGGNAEFAKTEQAEAFFENIEINAEARSRQYQPQFGGFSLELPVAERIEKYQSTFTNPQTVFWMQALDSAENYYAAAQRQYHDFDYLEEDPFELKYFVKKFTHEDKFEIDTLFLEGEAGNLHSRFEISTTKGKKLYGTLQLHGPKYNFLLTDHPEEPARKEYFASQEFVPWVYQDSFKTYCDSVYHVSMVSPTQLNGYDNFFNSFSSYGFGSDGDDTYQGEEYEKLLTNESTSEQLKLRLETLHKYEEFSDLDEFWAAQMLNMPEDTYFKILSNDVLYTEKRDGYLSQAREIYLGDTNTHRVIRGKIILENGAIYSLYANVDSLGYSSAFVDSAFASFRPTEDTVIGDPVTKSKSELFFSDLQSGDSTLVAHARNSIYEVSFKDEDAEKIKDIVENFEHEDFEREERLNLLNRLAWLEEQGNIDYLKELYYENTYSSAYQFMILETLLDYESERGNKTFRKLILEEPPFTSESYGYYSLMNELDDSLELAPMLFPDLLTLTEFTEYRSSIYNILETLVDSNLVKGKNYRERYKSILLFARVELKKQRASEEEEDDDKTNYELKRYNKLLTPFAHKKDVKEHYRNVLGIENEQILARQLEVIAPHIKIPDSIWEFVAKSPRALKTAYSYLKSVDQLSKIPDERRQPHILAKAIMLDDFYSSYDTVSFIKKVPVEIKPYPADAYFYRAKDEDDKLWRLLYFVTERGVIDPEEYAIAESGEQYNADIDDLDEIIKDAIREIETYQRARAQTSTRSYY